MNPFKKMANCNYALQLLQDHLQVEIYTGAKDIVQKHQKNVKGVLWALMRAYFVKNYGVKTDEEVREWADQFL